MTRNGCSVFDRSVFSYIPAIGKVGIFVSHHAILAASRPTPRICDTGSGEKSSPFAYRPVLFYAVRGVARRIRHLGDPIDPIRFAHFPWMADFPVALSHRRAIL